MQRVLSPLVALTAGSAVILSNHGLLAWGDTLPYTFAVLWTLQRACDVQVAAQACGASDRLKPRPCSCGSRRCSNGG